MKTEGLKILLVDDEPDLCHVLSWEFEDVGMIVTQSGGAYDATEILKKEEFDIILSDIKMPAGDGVELLDYIHNNNVKTKAVYLMTGYSDYPVKDLLKIGLTKLFKKPIDLDEFIEVVRALD